MRPGRSLSTGFIVTLPLLFILLRTDIYFRTEVSYGMKEYLGSAHGQTGEGEPPRENHDKNPMAEPAPGLPRERMMMREGSAITPEEMRQRMAERMRDVSPPQEVPFYRERTFLFALVGAFILIIVWVIKRRGIRPWRGPGKQGFFVNEAILVVDLCESTRLAVTQGDAFAMRIKNKMKQCVRDVSGGFGAKFLESIGDGYLVTFPTGADAVRAAIKILQNARDYNRDAPGKEKIELRAGINYGELIMDERGGRHGVAINKAFRIEGLKREERESLAEGLEPEAFPDKNRIFVSEELKGEIEGIAGIGVQPLGVFNLKGFTGLHRVYSIPWEDKGSG